MEHTRAGMDQGRHGGVNLVVFAVGALRFAVESRHVRAVVDLAPDPAWNQTTDQATHTPSLGDLLGLAASSEPGLSATPGSRERLLRLKRWSGPGPETGLTAGLDATTRDVRIQEPVSLVRAPIEALYPMPALITAVSALPCLRGLVGLCAANADDLAILLDPRRIPQAEPDTRQRDGQEDGPTTPAASRHASPEMTGENPSNGHTDHDQ